MIHRLKCWAENFDAIVDGKKTAEARVEEDRTYRVGDRLHLTRTTKEGRPTAPETHVMVDVTHIDRHAGALELHAMPIDRLERGSVAVPIAVISFKPPTGVFSKVRS
jgi:ASC-1-like (ASCH) protein